LSDSNLKQKVMIDQATLDGLRPTLARIARIAKTIFNAPAADVTLFQDGEPWRVSGRDGIGGSDPASELVRHSDKSIWVEDLTLDARFADHPAVTGVPHLRFYAGAPISIASGQRVGALAVYAMKPQAWDERQEGRLVDLAHVVGHECDLALANAERAALLDKVQRQEERLQIAATSANLHVFELDFAEQSFITAGADSSYFQAPGSYEEILSGDYGYVHPDDRENARSVFQRLITGDEFASTEWRVNRDDGQEFWVQASAKIFRDDVGRPLRLVGSLQNISDHKQNERLLAESKAFAEAANVAKSAFLAAMSHEIRTPLNGVLGMAQAMAADELSPVQRDRLNVVRESGETLLAILNDLLDFSKIEAGKLELESIEFDLAEIARGAHATFTAMANKKGLSFGLDIKAAEGVYRGDPTRVRQILYNLISNALKFTEEGEIKVASQYADGVLILRVADTGIGMTAATRAALFSKFGQADASTTRKFGGTGLGLAICKELTALMGGDISVESTPGEGSTFTVTLPLERTGNAAPRGETAPETPAEARPLELRVLAAEDNSVNQLVLKTLLSQIGIEPVIVENGQLAVQAWEDGEWDIVLMDVQMPVMDGPTAVRAIRAREAKTGRKPTPIVALTANAMSHQVAEYLAAGMDDHLAKPLEAAKLFEVLAKVLEDSEDPEREVLRA
jgi:signal transduction histidine kinase/ActR/RegA family two-component response regulator